MMRTLKRLAKHESGQAMAEFTVIFPWVLIFFTVILQLGSMWEAYQLVQLASWQAARYAAVHPGEHQPNSPYDDSGIVGPDGVSDMELAAELVMLPISPVGVGRDNPLRPAFRCTTGNDGRCLTISRGLPLLPHTGPDTAPVYTSEIQTLEAGGGNADIHHRYIYAHNMTTVKLIDLTDSPLGLGNMLTCSGDPDAFVGGGDETLHDVPVTCFPSCDAAQGLGRNLIAVETTYMFDMVIPVANWVIFSTWGILQSAAGSGCVDFDVDTLDYPDDFNDVDFGMNWANGGTPPYVSTYDSAGPFWGRVRKLALDLSKLEDLVDEIANPLMPDGSKRFIHRGIVEQLCSYLDDQFQFVFPLRTRTMVNLQTLEDLPAFDRDGDGNVDPQGLAY